MNIFLVLLILYSGLAYSIQEKEHYQLRGDLAQGSLLRGTTLPQAKLYLDGRSLRISKQGHFVFGFGRDAPSTAVLRIDYPDGKSWSKVLEIRQREYEIQHIDGLDMSTVSPPVEALERIREEARLISIARQRDDLRTDFMDDFVWPIKGLVTGVYGSQRVLNSKPRRPHYGIDIAQKAGTSVKAPASGIISFVYDEMYFSGKTLVIDHGHGVSSTFLHLSRFLVKQEDIVKQGQLIAEVGSSGRTTGAHLDWRINWFERRIDPGLLMDTLVPSPN